MKNHRTFLGTTSVMAYSARVVSNPRPEGSRMKNHRSFLGTTRVAATRLTLATLAIALLTATLVATAATPPATFDIEVRQVKLDALAFRQAQWIAANTTPTAAAEMWVLDLDATAARLAQTATARPTPTEAQEMLAIKRQARDDLVLARHRPIVKPRHRCSCDPWPKDVLAEALWHESLAADRA